MKSSRVLAEIFIIFMSFYMTHGQIDTVWGFVNSDSLRIDLPMVYTLNTTAGTTAAMNATMRASRTIHGLRLRSINNLGTVGDIIEGGIGFSFVTFMLAGRANYLYFTAEAFENYTTNTESTTPILTTPIPERTFRDWGTVDYASLVLFPRTYYTATTFPNEISQHDATINVSKNIDGIRLISHNETVASGDIINGGIGFNFTTIRVLARANYLSFSIEIFENGTYTTPMPTTVPTTPTPEKKVTELGKIDDEVILLDKKNFSNYPSALSTAEENVTLSYDRDILGIRLTSLNYTDGLWNITDGGLAQNFVTFNFKGAATGRPYDFNVEIFGNSAVTKSLSIALVILLSVVFNVLK